MDLLKEVLNELKPMRVSVKNASNSPKFSPKSAPKPAFKAVGQSGILRINAFGAKMLGVGLGDFLFTFATTNESITSSVNPSLLFPSKNGKLALALVGKCAGTEEGQSVGGKLGGKGTFMFTNHLMWTLLNGSKEDIKSYTIDGVAIYGFGTKDGVVTPIFADTDITGWENASVFDKEATTRETLVREITDDAEITSRGIPMYPIFDMVVEDKIKRTYKKHEPEVNGDAATNEDFENAIALDEDFTEFDS